MTTYADKILGKPSDYYICPECNTLNWYENEDCKDCNHLAPEINDEMEKRVLFWVNRFYDFDDYSEEEMDLIKIDC